MPKALITNYERASLCYFLTYMVLPRYISDDPATLLQYFAKDPQYTARFLYMLACKFSDHEPNPQDVQAIAGHVGTLAGVWNYNIIEYPVFSPVNMFAAKQGGAEREGIVLAPYFSAVLFRDPAKIDYYTVLGQSPMGGTTLREVTREYNANLGPGCEPTLGAFTALLDHELTVDGKLPTPIAAVKMSPGEPDQN
jgi:hypothetical protein